MKGIKEMRQKAAMERRLKDLLKYAGEGNKTKAKCAFQDVSGVCKNLKIELPEAAAKVASSIKD